MDRLISLEPSNTVTIRIEPGQRCFGVLTLRNVMHTMPVAFRARPVNKARYTVSPQSGIIPPLATLTLEITYLLPAPTTHSNDNNLPEHFPHYCDDDSFVLQSVLAPGASIKNPTSTHDFSVPDDWFTNKKKQVYSDSGIKIVFVGSWVLTHLVAKGCMDEIRAVLENSEPVWRSVDSTDIDGQPLLHLAVSQGRADLVQLLLEFGPDVEALNRSGSSPLEAASASGDALIVELLLAHKARPEKSRRSARGPIHLASGNGHAEVLKHLLQKGANVNSLTKDGNTALHLAVEETRRDCAGLLLANSARTDVRNSSYGDTPLHVASTLGDEYMLKLLLHKGAYKDVRNKAGKTSYDLAAENGHAKLFDALRLGDDLCAAARKGELRMVLRMLESGASINGRDQKGWTPLHRACFKGRVDVVRVLVDKGIDVNAKDDEGYTALLCAVEAGQMDVIELLLKRGVDVEARTNKGVGALQIAESLQYSGIVRMLSSKHSLNSNYNKGYNNNVSVKIKEMDFDVTKKRPVNKSGISLGSSLDRSEPLAVVI